MKKKAVAVAVGTLFAAPAAYAQITFGNESIGTVQLYGKLYPQYGYVKGSGSSQPGTEVSTLVSTTGTLAAGPEIPNHRSGNNVDASNSRLGFRGQRDLGNTGLKGIWQGEQKLGLDTGDGTWSSR